MKTPPLSVLLTLFVLATLVTSLALAWVNPDASKASFTLRWGDHALRHGWAAGLAVVVATLLLRR